MFLPQTAHAPNSIFSCKCIHDIVPGTIDLPQNSDGEFGLCQFFKRTLIRNDGWVDSDDGILVGIFPSGADQRPSYDLIVHTTAVPFVNRSPVLQPAPLRGGNSCSRRRETANFEGRRNFGRVLTEAARISSKLKRKPRTERLSWCKCGRG